MSNKEKPIILIGKPAQKRFAKVLSQHNFKPLYLPADTRLALPVSTHADMLIFKINDTIICNDDYFRNNSKIFDVIQQYGYNVISAKFNVSSDYPNDIALNQAVIGNFVLGLESACEKQILNSAKKYGYTYINTKQGYAKCSTLVLGKDAIISADSSIISLAQKLGIDTLKIENHNNNILLNGYNYGFIGGASFVSNSVVYFFGNLDLHSDNKKIRSFCESHGFSTVSLDNDMLYDFGGAIVLPYIQN